MSERLDGRLSILAGGDVAPVVQPVDRLVDLIEPVLGTADARIVQCERTYSERGTFPHWSTIPHGRWSRLDPSYATVFQRARADVVSVAGNHALDYGYEALEDTMSLFRSWGMQVVGGGADEAEAREPAIIEKDGIRVAVLAYCSVLREGQAAIEDHPGIAAIRVRTWYVPTDFQPGCPPTVMSEAYPEDVASMQADVAAAKKNADAVIVLLHWGLRYIPKVLATYQTPVAHAAIDAGADVIVGHHPHTLKAIEVYRGKVCFYSIGNFLSTGNQSKEKVSKAEWNLFWYERIPDSLYGFPPHCREMVLPRIEVSKSGIERVSMVPCMINDLAQPRPLSSDDRDFEDVLDKLEWVSDQFDHTFTVDGNEIVVTA